MSARAHDRDGWRRRRATAAPRGSARGKPPPGPDSHQGRPALAPQGLAVDDGGMIHSDGFRSLDRRECLRLLARAPVGRVVCTRRALPAVLPVNFSLDTDSSVVLCTSVASDLVRAVDGVVVAFEADDFDAGSRSGWSVVVTGRAAVVTDPAEHERLLRTGPRSWMPMHDGVFVRIEAEMVTGRELTGLSESR